MKKIYIILILTICLAKISFSQQILQDNQFVINKFALSPAYTGYNNNTETFATIRNNWVGIEGAPQKVLINMNSSVNNNMGLGASLIMEETGIFSNISALASYAYKVKISKSQSLSLGLNAGVFRTQLDLSQNINPLETDNVILRNQVQTGSAFDAGLGVLYRFNSLNIGVNIPRILEPQVKNEINEKDVIYTLKKHIIIHGSYNYAATADVEIEPVVITYLAGGELQYNISALAKYKGLAWLGFIYRDQGIMGANIGGRYNQLLFNYAYEFSGKGILAHSSGSHEFSIGVTLGEGRKKAAYGNKPYINW